MDTTTRLSLSMVSSPQSLLLFHPPRSLQLHRVRLNVRLVRQLGTIAITRYKPTSQDLDARVRVS